MPLHNMFHEAKGNGNAFVVRLCSNVLCSNLGWVGGKTEFTQSRKDRGGGDSRSHNSEGLDGVEKELVDRDAKASA